MGCQWFTEGRSGAARADGLAICAVDLGLSAGPYPQAILVLEGQTSRVRFAAQFSRQHPSLPLWVSGNPQGQALNESIFRQAAVPSALVQYDSCATDTVTNFTCTVSDFKARRIRHVYVITSITICRDRLPLPPLCLAAEASG